MKLRVLIADDDASMRDALADLISGEDALELVGIAENAEQAVELARERNPDVAVLDVKMPGGGPRASRGILACSPDTAVIALSAHEDEQSVKDMLAAGAGSYLVKGTRPHEIVDAIQASVRGGSALSEVVASQVVGELSARLQRERTREKHRRTWEHRIRGVLGGRDEFDVLFQPISDLTSGRVLGLEALARFTAEPITSPDVWFAEAAVVGLSLPLEMATIDAALASLGMIPADVYLAVNASPEAVMSARLGAVLDEARSHSIVIEVTEHAPIRDYPKLRAALKYLRSCGVRLAVDDAGAGYASLRHILQLEPNFIKLDISLTRGIDVDSPKRALAAALVTFAREIGAEIIAEGIETPDELRMLQDLGVTRGQGFYLGAPGPLARACFVEGPKGVMPGGWSRHEADRLPAEG